MRYVFVIIIFTFITGCSYNVFFENENTIYGYNIESNKIDKIITSKNPIWGFEVKDSKIAAYTEEIPNYDSEKNKYYLGDIKLVNYKSKKIIKTIGEKDASENTPKFYKDKLIYVYIKNHRKKIKQYDFKKNSYKILSNSGMDSIFPVINENKNILLFQSYKETNETWEIFIYDLQKEMILEKIDYKNSLQYPSFSKDGTEIVIEETEEDKTFISLYNLENRKIRRISELGNETSASFSLDSKRILYISSGEVYMYRISDGKTTKLITGYNSRPKQYMDNIVFYDTNIEDKWFFSLYRINTQEIKTISEGGISTINLFY